MLFSFILQLHASPAQCSYTYGVWNIQHRKITRRVQVKKLRIDLRTDEVGDFGCTPCIEEQVEVRLSNGISFSACNRIAAPVQDALEQALFLGQKIESVEGYRPTMTRGSTNAQGERTILSNHAFGAAIDINRAHNGLYDQCFSMNPTCRLIQGGAWNPNHPLSLTKTNLIVKKMIASGFLWGGEIDGKQKDMMHFSRTGY